MNGHQLPKTQMDRSSDGKVAFKLGTLRQEKSQNWGNDCDAQREPSVIHSTPLDLIEQ